MNENDEIGQRVPVIVFNLLPSDRGVVQFQCGVNLSRRSIGAYVQSTCRNCRCVSLINGRTVSDSLLINGWAIVERMTTKIRNQKTQ